MQAKSLTMPWGAAPAAIATIQAHPIVEARSGGVELIEQHAAEWRALCDEGPCARPFFRPEWFAAYVRAFAPQQRLLLLTARTAGRLRAVLPLVEERALWHGLPVRKLRSAANVYSGCFDLVHGANAAPAVQAIWQALSQRRGWDLLELCDVPQGGACEHLLTAAQQAGHPAGQWPLSPGQFLTLPEGAATPEQALAHVTTKFRKDLRRRERKFADQGALQFVRTAAADQAELERFYQLESSGWKGQQGTAIACAAETRRFYDEVAAAAAQFGYLSLYRLDCGARTVAMQYALTYGSYCALLKPAYDESFSQFSPGHILTQHVIGDLLARGVTEYDLLTPQAQWKGEWTNGLRPHAHCYIFANNVWGRTLHAFKFRWLTAARQLKRRWQGTLAEIK